MRKRDVKWALDGVKGFPAPKIKNEQYMTPADLASSIGYVLGVENNDILDKKVLDLGCGTGMLSVTAILFGARKVTGVDIDEEVKKVYEANLSRVSSDSHEFIKADVTDNKSMEKIGKYDTAIINPPFGTKNNKGIDILFLERGLEKADVVYSMHKTSTREYLERKYKGRIKVLSRMRFELKKTYKFQKKESVHIEVDLIRVISSRASQSQSNQPK